MLRAGLPFHVFRDFTVLDGGGGCHNGPSAICMNCSLKEPQLLPGSTLDTGGLLPLRSWSFFNTEGIIHSIPGKIKFLTQDKVSLNILFKKCMYVCF